MVCVCVFVAMKQWDWNQMNSGVTPTIVKIQLPHFLCYVAYSWRITDCHPIGQSCLSGVESEEVYVIVCRNPIGTQWVPRRLRIDRSKARAFITIW